MRLLEMISIFGIGTDAYLIVLCICVPLFFVWRRIFKKIKNQNKRIVVTWLITLLSAPIAYILIFAAIFLIPMYYPNRNFDKVKWMNNKDTRYEYANNIINSKMLIGKSPAEVERLLGTDHFNEQYGGWFYDLGFTPGSIDPDSIEIDFKNGKVANVIRHEHH
jgi:amino acid transporter